MSMVVSERASLKGRLPTRAQIEAITDAPALTALRDDIDRTIAKIETDLDFLDADLEWEARARSALSIHRYTNAIIGRRLKALCGPGIAKQFGALAAVKTSNRERADCSALGLELIDGWDVDLDSIFTLDDAVAAEKALVSRIEALRADREDEVQSFDPGARDEVWLARVATALRRSGQIRQDILRKAASLRKDLKLAQQAVRDANAAEAFINAARDVLDQATYMAIWAQAERRQLAAAQTPPQPSKAPEGS